MMSDMNLESFMTNTKQKCVICVTLNFVFFCDKLKRGNRNDDSN